MTKEQPTANEIINAGTKDTSPEAVDNCRVISPSVCAIKIHLAHVVYAVICDVGSDNNIFHCYFCSFHAFLFDVFFLSCILSSLYFENKFIDYNRKSVATEQQSKKQLCFKKQTIAKEKILELRSVEDNQSLLSSRIGGKIR